MSKVSNNYTGIDSGRGWYIIDVIIATCKATNSSTIVVVKYNMQGSQA